MSESETSDNCTPLSKMGATKPMSKPLVSLKGRRRNPPMPKHKLRMSARKQPNTRLQLIVERLRSPSMDYVEEKDIMHQSAPTLLSSMGNKLIIPATLKQLDPMSLLMA